MRFSALVYWFFGFLAIAVGLWYLYRFDLPSGFAYVFHDDLHDAIELPLPGTNYLLPIQPFSAIILGVFLILRRMSLTGDAMAHAILPGAAIGYLVAGLSLGAMTAGGMIAGFVVAIASASQSLTTPPAGMIGRRGRRPSDRWSSASSAR